MASGRPDWYSSVAMHGKFVEVGEVDRYITVGVDEDGNMLGMMHGSLGGVRTPILVSAGGVMQADLVLQSLPAMTIRPFYTESKYFYDIEPINPNETKEVFRITGEGIILGGFCTTLEADYHDASVWYIVIDDVEFSVCSLTGLQNAQAYQPTVSPLYIINDQPTNDRFHLGIMPGLTFEESFVVRVRNDVGEVADSFLVQAYYALRP